MSIAERVKLQEFQLERADELVLMWRASFEKGVGIIDRHSISEQREYLLSKVVPNNTILVAALEGKIVGFVAASRESIAQLYIHVDYHRNGIGSMLLKWAKTQSRGTLWLHTFERNTNAIRFYEYHGFRIVRRGFEEMWQLPDLKYSWRQSVPLDAPAHGKS